MRAIILGCGRLGASIANLLFKEGHEVSVIDNDPDAFRRLSKDFIGKKLVGIGFDRDILLESGIETADAFIAVSRGDNHNVVSSLIAKNIFKVPRVVARIYDPERAKLYWSLGIATISPVSWAANQIKSYLFYHEFNTLCSFGQADVVIIEVECPHHLLGRSVEELHSPQEIEVIAISRQGRSRIPIPGTILEEGDILHIAVSAEAMQRLKGILRG